MKYKTCVSIAEKTPYKIKQTLKIALKKSDYVEVRFDFLKIERRPMLMIKASVAGDIGGIIAQDAETIRFVKPNGQLVSVTHLKKGDVVMVHAKSATGRHFGMEVSDEYILEK